MKIYQTLDFHPSFDYEENKVNLEEYRLVFESSRYDNSNLEEIFEYFNVWEDEFGTIKQTFRSLSVGDIVELNGKFFRCEPIGWKDMTDKIEAKSVLVAKEK